MIEIKKLSKGSYIAHKDEPYIIRDIKSVIIGTHSHAKIKAEIEGLFSGKKETLSIASHERVEDVEIIRAHGQLIAKMGESVQVMSMDDYSVFDAEISPELLSAVSEGDDVTYINFKGRVRVIEKREK